MQIQKPPVGMYQRRQVRHWSRTTSCLAMVFVSILMVLLTCIASIALYLVFPPAPLDILIMGLDARGNEGTASRTDSIMIVGVNPRQLDVSVLSIPRDVFINVPGYGLQRINTVNVLGEGDQPGSGPVLLANAIENSFGIGIDNTVRLDFQAFVALVDAVGGVTIDVPYTVVDDAFPTDDFGTMTVRFEAGVQHMDGETALIYARTRHQDDDYRRAERQQQVIRALSQRLLNPTNWTSAWLAIQNNTETNLTVLDLAAVMPTVLLNAGNMNQLVVNRDYVLPGDGYVIPNYDALAPYTQAHFD